MKKKEYKALADCRTELYEKACNAMSSNNYTDAVRIFIEVLKYDHQMIESWHLGTRNQLIDSLKALTHICNSIWTCLVSECNGNTSNEVAEKKATEAHNIYAQEIDYLGSLVTSDFDRWGSGYTGYCLYVATAELHLDSARLLAWIFKPEKSLSLAQFFLNTANQLPYYRKR